jgi:hypothetical protein
LSGYSQEERKENIKGLLEWRDTSLSVLKAFDQNKGIGILLLVETSLTSSTATRYLIICLYRTRSFKCFIFNWQQQTFEYVKAIWIDKMQIITESRLFQGFGLIFYLYSWEVLAGSHPASKVDRNHPVINKVINCQSAALYVYL